MLQAISFLVIIFLTVPYPSRSLGSQRGEALYLPAFKFIRLNPTRNLTDLISSYEVLGHHLSQPASHDCSQQFVKKPG